MIQHMPNKPQNIISIVEDISNAVSNHCFRTASIANSLSGEECQVKEDQPAPGGADLRSMLLRIVADLERNRGAITRAERALGIVTTPEVNSNQYTNSPS